MEGKDKKISCTYLKYLFSETFVFIASSDFLKLASSAMEKSAQALEYMRGLPRSSTGYSQLLGELWTAAAMKKLNFNQVIYFVQRRSTL